MSEAAFLDADVLVRFFAGDDVRKQDAAARLLSRAEAGEIDLRLVATAVFEVFYVLTSRRLYNVDPKVAAELLIRLLQAPGVSLEDRSTVVRALELVPTTRTLGDAMIVATMEREGARTLYSFDRGFDRIPSIDRIEP